MEYISTRDIKKTFSFRDVFLKGLAPDGGLFVPKKIPFYDPQEIENCRNLSYRDLATKIILEFCGNDFDEPEVKDLVKKSYKNFRVPEVVKIKKLGKINLLELFHGPTLAFKDISMQLIGNMYEKILYKEKTKISIIVATSGDTGAAAIEAIKDKKNIKIFVIHPDKKISEVQRKFMTTSGSKNVFNIALEGNFDDCQKLVKSMFQDEDFRNSINMSGVNSINWARIAFQIVYYFYCYYQITTTNKKINFSVPTGNFGDIFAGYVAKKMGLPINKLLIATNKNDILKRVVKTGQYKPLKVEHTVSPSMDIQVASNFERLIFYISSHNPKRTDQLMNDLKTKGEFKLEKRELEEIQNNFSSESISEHETISMIKETYKQEGILVDPHTAVGIGASKKISFNENIIVLSTAHPSKFFEVVMKATDMKPELPENLKDILIKEEMYDKLPNNLEKLKKYILNKK